MSLCRAFLEVPVGAASSFRTKCAVLGRGGRKRCSWPRWSEAPFLAEVVGSRPLVRGCPALVLSSEAVEVLG